MADMITYQAAAGGSGVYRNNKVGFVASYYKKKEMDDLYPAGGFNVCGQVGKGRDEIGTITAADARETVYAVSRNTFHIKLLIYFIMFTFGKH